MQVISSDITENIMKSLNNMKINLHRMNPMNMIPRNIPSVYLPVTTYQAKPSHYKSSPKYSRRKKLLQKIDEIHAMVKKLVEDRKYDSYGEPINKQKRFVTQPQHKSVQRNISADIMNILQQMKLQEPRIKSTLQQIEFDVSQKHKSTAAAEESVVEKIDSILTFLDSKARKRA